MPKRLKLSNKKPGLKVDKNVDQSQKTTRGSTKTQIQQWIEETLEDPIEIPEIPDEPPGDEPDTSSLSASDAAELRDILQELARRENEALRLYEPQGLQIDFHSSQAQERLFLGGNRAGKTLCACVEDARAATGQDPWDKYSRTDGRLIIVGKDERHVSKVLYRKLFKPGAFKVIYDPILCKIRAYRPWLEWDRQNSDKAKASPPLIPQRFYSHTDISWNNKREEVPKTIRLRTGWELNFFSGLAAPPNGWDADAAHFDEEIEHPLWYTETSARLLDRRVQVGPSKYINGRFVWSATPQAGTQHLYDLYERAQAAKHDPSPSVVSFETSLLENAHISREAKDDFVAKIQADENEYQVRVQGQFAILGARVYTELAPRGAHGCESFPIPDDWCRYAAIDPGRQVAAALFMAIPPPNVEHIERSDGTIVRVKGKRILYDELYVRRSSAALFAERMLAKIGDTRIRSWWMDVHGGKISDIGSGRAVAEQYSEEFARLGIKCETTAQYFAWASDDKKAGIDAVRRGLHIRDGEAEWLLFHDKLPEFLNEVKKYVYKKNATTGVVTDEPLARANHLMDAWRYLAMARPGYVRPKPRKHAKNYALAAMEAKRKRERARQGSGYVKLW